MKPQNGAISMLALLMISPAGASTFIAGTSFESVPTLSNDPSYIDTLGSTSDHALINNADQPFVHWTPGVGQTELGFSSHWSTNNDGSPGLTNSQTFGVYGNGQGVVPDGSNVFIMAAPEGVARLAFDAVDLTGTTSPTASLMLRVQATTWELDDFVHVYVIQDDGQGGQTQVDLLNTIGSDIDSLGIEGTAYLPYSASLTPGILATFVVEFDSDVANIENIRFDSIAFNDVPGPGGLAVFGLALLGSRRRRH